MNDFLDKVFFDNSIRTYITVASVIFFILLIRRYVAHLVAALIFQIVRSIWKNVDQRSFTNLVIKPLGGFLVILVSIITLHKLKFPTVLDVDIYRITLKELIHMMATILLIIAFIRLLLRMIDFVAMILHIKADRTHDSTDDQLIVFFKDFFKVILSIIGLLMILKFAFGYNVSNLLTGLSIVGAAIALALRESLENLIASFIIFFDKPFTMGDVVKVHAFTGTVEKIGLRSTRIRTDQKTFITVPNKQMVDSILDNLTQRTQRKGELRLEIGVSTSSQKVQALLQGIRQLLNRPQVESSTVLLNDIHANSFAILVDYYTAPTTLQEFNLNKEQINMEVLQLMEKLGIELSGASTDIKILSTEPPASA